MEHFSDKLGQAVECRRSVAITHRWPAGATKICPGSCGGTSANFVRLQLLWHNHALLEIGLAADTAHILPDGLYTGERFRGPVL
jgi:hypothetical protein